MSTIVIDSPERKVYAQRVIDKLSLERRWALSIEPHKEKRTLPQNARLWLLHTAASEVTGYSPEEMHEHALCRHFGFTEREVTDPFTGEILRKRTPNKRSSTRNTKEFAEFMEATEAWYIEEFGVVLE